MSATTVETPALAELERLRGAVGAQRQRVASLEDEARESARRVEMARAALAEHYRDRERRGGDVPVEQGERERALVEELHDAEGGLSVRPVIYPSGGDTADVGLTMVDTKAEAMVAGATELLAEREAELREFVIRRLPDLALERASRAREVAERCERALRAAADAAGAYEAERTWWASTLSLTTGEGDSPVIDVPGNPLAGLQVGARVVPPMPERFT